MVEQRNTQSPEHQEIQQPECFAKLEKLWAIGNFVCVGLDSDYHQIPEGAKILAKIYKGKQARMGWEIFSFNTDIIDATYDLVCAYKPNIAFYEDSLPGERALERTVAYIHDKNPEIPVLGDIKRADIGNSLEGYVRAAFGRYNFDAVTVNPYFGKEALEPFLARRDKGIFVLVKTSNPGEKLQDWPVSPFDGPETDLLMGRAPEFFREGCGMAPIWAYVAASVVLNWNKNGNCGIVFGATYPKEMAIARKIVGEMPILIPGVGVQKGDLKATVEAGMDSRGWGIIINSARGIIFASKGKDFAEAARQETIRLREEINRYR